LILLHSNDIANRVDGKLFLNLSDDDWDDMGITNRFHKRKLQLVMIGHRKRFERERDRLETNDEDDLTSEYAPSELSDIIASEDRAVAAEAVHDQENPMARTHDRDDDDDDYSSEEEKSNNSNNIDGRNAVSGEQQQTRAMDAQNIRIELVVRGDGVNYPVSA